MNYDEFDCPRFVDFNDLTAEDDEGLDEWFDVNHEEDDPTQMDFAVTEPSTQDAASSTNSEPEEGETEAEVRQETEDHSHLEVAIKSEKRSSGEETFVPHHSPAKQQQHHDSKIKEEPMTTDAENTDIDDDESKQQHRRHGQMTVEGADVRVKVEKSDGETMEPHTTENEENGTDTTSRSGNESSDQSSNNRVTPRKKQSTPGKTLRRSMRKKGPSNMVTSWEHRKKPVTYSNGTPPTTRRSSGSRRELARRVEEGTEMVLKATQLTYTGSQSYTPTANPNLKSSEQIELEKIEEAKKALEKSRQQAQQSLKMVRSSSGYMPTRSKQAPTKPSTFHFQTDDRIKTAKELEREEELERERLAKKKARAKRRRPTIKAPLLATSHKRRTDLAAQPPPRKAVKTFALQVQEFQNKTPDRFHSKPVNEQNKGPCPPPSHPHTRLGVTIPMSPALKSKTRKRPITVLSTAEREEQELEEIRKYKFKANPVDSRILVCSGANTSMSTSSSKRSREDEEEKFEFHARPIPSKILEGVTGVGKAKQLPITCPKSPAFALKNRVRPKEPEPPKEDEADKIKARPVPHLGIPFKPTLDHKATEPAPFSFEERDREIPIKKEARLQEIQRLEQEARIFHAQPVPEPKEPSDTLPQKKLKPLTKVEPFNIEDIDGAKRAEKWAEEVQKELVEQKKRSSSFRARPANVLYKEPFVPEKPTKPLTDISDFTLNTEKRAVEREDFERKKYEMEMMKAAEMERQRQLEEDEERLRIARLRQETVHKAQPIHHFKGVVVRPSDKPLTMAESPRFTDRRRSKAVDQ